MSTTRFSRLVPLLLATLGITEPGGLRAQEADVDRMLADMRHAEEACRCLWLRGSWTTQVWDRDTGAFGDRPVDWFVAAYDGQPGGRTYLARNTPDARPPDLEPTNRITRYVARFDGHVGLQIYENSGRGEEESPHATIAAGIPNEIKDWGWTASLWRASLPGMGALERQRFSAIIPAAMRRDRLPVSVGKEEFEGTQAVYVRVDDGSSRRTVYLDPDRGHAMLAMILEKMGEIRVAYRVHELKEVAPGFYYPVKGERRSWSAKGVPSEIGTLAVAEIHANDPQRLEGLFELSVPQGVTVHDEISDLTVGSGRSADAVQEILRRDVARILSTGSPASDPSILVLDAPPHRKAPAGSTHPRPGGSRRLWGIGLITASVAGLGILFARRRALKGAALSFALGALVHLSGPAAIAQDAPVGLASLKGFRAHSCGLNACGLLLGIFGEGFDAEKAALALDVGPLWDRPASLLDMVRYLTSRGLSTRSLKAEGFDPVLAHAAPESPVIVHMKGGVFRSGHYFVFCKSHEDRVLVADPGYGLAWVSMDRLKVQYEPFFSGHFVVVSKPLALEKREDVFDISAGTIRIPAIAAVQEKGELRVPIALRNDTGTDLAFKNAYGSCACFAGAAPEAADAVVRKDSVVRMIVSYTKPKLQLGFNEQQVRILFEGRPSREITLHLEFHVTAAPTEDKIALLPESLDFRCLPASTAEVSVILPATISIQGIRTSDERLSARTLGSAAAAWERDAAPRRVHRIEVTLSGEQPPELARWVALDLNGTELKTLTIPVVPK